MRFIQIRDLRPSEIWEQLADEREMVIIAQGKPIAILSSVSDANWEETLAAFRRVRAVQAVDELQKQSVENGLDKMDLEGVNREIQAVRKSTISEKCSVRKSFTTSPISVGLSFLSRVRSTYSRL